MHLPQCTSVVATTKMADATAVNVAEVLSAAERETKERFKSVEVTKDIEPAVDCGNLLAVDLQPLDVRGMR